MTYGTETTWSDDLVKVAVTRWMQMAQGKSVFRTFGEGCVQQRTSFGCYDEDEDDDDDCVVFIFPYHHRSLYKSHCWAHAYLIGRSSHAGRLRIGNFSHTC